VKKIMFGVALTAALWLAGAASAFAWHTQAQCVANGSTITGTAQWYGFSYGHDQTYLEIYRVKRSTDQWRKVAEFTGTGLATSVSYVAPVNDEFTGQPATVVRTYVVKAWFDVAEGGAHKSQDCVVPPPTPDCKGNMVPPGTPVTPPEVLCPPPPPPPPPVVVPPVPPVVTPPPPPPPAPKRCVGPYHIKVTHGATLAKVTFRNDAGKRVRADFQVNGGARVKNQRVLKLSRREWRGVRSLRAWHSLFPRTVRCGAFRRVNQPPSTPPRTVG
jgi:hypothetical protein